MITSRYFMIFPDFWLRESPASMGTSLDHLRARPSCMLSTWQHMPGASKSCDMRSGCLARTHALSREKWHRFRLLQFLQTGTYLVHVTTTFFGRCLVFSLAPVESKPHKTTFKWLSTGEKTQRALWLHRRLRISYHLPPSSRCHHGIHGDFVDLFGFSKMLKAIHS